MIVLAGVGPDAFGVQAFHHIRRGHAVNDDGHQPLARRVVRTAENADMGHVAQPGQVAGAIDHRVGQMLFIGVNGVSGRDNALSPVGCIGNPRAQPIEIVHHIGCGGIGAGVPGPEFPAKRRPVDQIVMGHRAQPV